MYIAKRDTEFAAALHGFVNAVSCCCDPLSYKQRVIPLVIAVVCPD